MKGVLLLRAGGCFLKAFNNPPGVHKNCSFTPSQEILMIFTTDGCSLFSASLFVKIMSNNIKTQIKSFYSTSGTIVTGVKSKTFHYYFFFSFYKTFYRKL